MEVKRNIRSCNSNSYSLAVHRHAAAEPIVERVDAGKISAEQAKL